MTPTQQPIFTVGHSGRSDTELIDLLVANGVELVMDVRRLPGSSRFPQFDEDRLRATLGEAGLRLRRVEALTGRRPVNRDIPFEVNAWWENRSFHNFADHALSPAFHEALIELTAAAEDRRLALMCSEAVWW